MSEEKKIIIDEDWKNQVEREKEQGKQPESAEVTSDASAKSEVAAEKPAEKSKSSAANRMQMPPASLSFLIQTLATQAIMSMSDQPHPATGKVERDIPQAKHFIDMLAVLQEKTNGNRTPEESAFLDGALYELRMVFVEESKKP